MDDEPIITQIAELIQKFKNYPQYQVAQRIFKEVLVPLLEKQKSIYEKLFYTDPDNKH